MSASSGELAEPSPSGVGEPRQRVASGSKLFLGGLSWDTSEDKLREHFERYGELVEVVVMRDRMTGRPRGFGFVTFEDQDAAERAVKDVHLVDGRQASGSSGIGIDVKKSVPQEGKPKACKVFVGGLAPETTEDDFKEYFGKFGQVAEVQIMQDHMSGRSRGFGFVTFDEDVSAEKVFDFGNMHELGGKRVEVKAATPKGSGSQASRQPQPGRSSSEFDPTSMSAYSSGIPGASPYPPYPLYSYGGRPGMMPPYGSTMQYSMPPQYMMMPGPPGISPFPPSGPSTYGTYQTPYSGPGRGGPPSGMPFTPPSPHSMVPQHPFSTGGLYPSSSPSPSPPYRSSAGGGLQSSKNNGSRGKVDSASSLDAQHAERQLKNLSLDR